MIVIENDEKIFFQKVYRGEDSLDVFLKDLYILSVRINAILTFIEDIKITDQQKYLHECANKCYLCNEEFVSDKNRKVFDHDHLTGYYRGAAHQNCNLRYTLPKKIPLFFHNLKNYDSHFIIASLTTNSFKNCKIVPQSMEKFISFSLDNIQVLDSCNFLSESLEKLVNNLRNSGGKFPITCEIFKMYIKIDSKNKELLFFKSIYPYEYMDSFEKFKETTLPSIENFYSSLNLKSISEEEYQTALNIWEKFEFKNLLRLSQFLLFVRYFTIV